MPRKYRIHLIMAHCLCGAPLIPSGSCTRPACRRGPDRIKTVLETLTGLTAAAPRVIDPKDPDRKH
jgi:hypothetical protein